MHIDNQTQSIKEFCKANGISESFFYKLRKQGRAPRTLSVGRRTLITAEAAEEWRKLMETPAQGGAHG